MVMTRKRHALIVLVTPQGKYLLGKKNAYPKNISRLVGGGIDPHEDAAVGASRELQEELGIEIPPQDLAPLAHITSTVNLPQSQQIAVETFVYGCVLSDQPLSPADDLDGIAYLDAQEMEDLIARFASLPADLVSPKGGDMPFRWSDYGNFMSKVHRIAVDEMCAWWKKKIYN